MHGEISWVLLLGLVSVLGTMAGWFWEVIKEAEFGGYHNPVVQVGMRYGMALFIASEVMFFVAWFWAYFNAALSPTEQIDGTWPARYPDIRYLGPAVPQYPDPADVGHHGHLGASRAARGQPYAFPADSP